MRRERLRSWACLMAGLLVGGLAARAQQLLVLEKEDGTMAIVDVPTLKVVGRVPVGRDPHEAAASEDGKFGYASNYGGPASDLHTIGVVDLKEHKALDPIDIAPLHGAHGLQVLKGKLYFTAETNKAIGRYDLATGKVDWVLGTGQNRTDMVMVSADEKRIVTSNVASGTMTVMDWKEGTPMGRPPAPPPGGPAGPPPMQLKGFDETVIKVGPGGEGFDLTPDGKEIWVANAGDGTVSVVDPEAKTVTATLKIPTRSANRLKFTRDGKMALIADLGSGDVVFVDRETRKEVKRINIGHGAAGILMDPDGTRAFVASPVSGKVVVVDLKTMAAMGEIAVGRGPDGMAWVAAQ